MSLVRIQDAATEPVTDAEVAAHLRLDSFTARPGSAPTVALSDPAAPGDVDAGVHRYRVTFVTPSGETDGGRISVPVTIDDASVNGTVALSAIPIGGAGVTARKLYRTKADQDEYFLVATIADNTSTTYTDDAADEDLGAGEPSANGTAADPLIPALVMAARQSIEEHLGRALVAQQWRLTLDAFPRGTTPIELGRPPLVSVESVAYIDPDGATQTLTTDNEDADDDDFTVDADSFIPRLIPIDAWPATKPVHNAVTITFTAGYGDAQDVPAPIKAAILLTLGDLYRNRESQIIAASVAENRTVEALLGPYRIREFA